jgi:hypothetical protein
MGRPCTVVNSYAILNQLRPPELAYARGSRASKSAALGERAPLHPLLMLTFRCQACAMTPSFTGGTGFSMFCSFSVVYLVFA